MRFDDIKLELFLMNLIVVGSLVGFCVGIFYRNYEIKERALCLELVEYDRKTGDIQVTNKIPNKTDLMYLLKYIREDNKKVYIEGCNKK